MMTSSDAVSKYIGTDLACESGRISPDKYKSAKYERYEEEDVTVEILTVEDEAGRNESGKEIGRYVTVSSPALAEDGDLSRVARVIGDELSRLCLRATGGKNVRGTRVLVVGLGNRFITPDALGARCADKINATRHVKSAFPALGDMGCSEVCVLSPGVLGQTGIESSEIIKDVARGIDPDLIIVIDAMAARATSRLATTVQLSDAGLSPGGGIGNRRPAINREETGFPVVSVGSPTVVGSSTLILDALATAGIDDVPDALEKALESGRDFFVTLNDSDKMTERLSDVISEGVNRALGTSFLT